MKAPARDAFRTGSTRVRASDGVDQDHLAQWVEVRRGVEGFVEPRTAVSDVTLLLVAHDVNPLLAHVDRVVYVAAGRILSGPPERVITSETLSELYGSPVEVLRTSDGRLVVVGQPEAPHHHSDRHAHP